MVITSVITNKQLKMFYIINKIKEEIFIQNEILRFRYSFYKYIT